MKKILILFLSLSFFATNAQIAQKIKNEKPTRTNIYAEVAMLEVEYFDDNNNREFIGENISAYILGLSSTYEINKKLDITGSLGVTEGFSYNYLIKFSIVINYYLDGNNSSYTMY